MLLMLMLICYFATAAYSHCHAIIVIGIHHTTGGAAIYFSAYRRYAMLMLLRYAAADIATPLRYLRCRCCHAAIDVDAACCLRAAI